MGFVFQSSVPLAAASGLEGAPFCDALDDAVVPPEVTDLDRVVVFGIGGSALGARCIHEACRETARKPLAVVDNIDPELFEDAWLDGDPARATWVVVSKSGGTLEPLTQLAALRRRLPGCDLRVVTGASGPLREMATAEGLPVYDVPEEVGGRFSAFTPAATVPLALAGHDVHALLEGARGARGHEVAGRLANMLVDAETAGRNVVTLWSYAERLESVGEWFRQLWGESLGKDGRGQTPVHCVGSTDQHSMQQLMVEGPADKAVLVLTGPQATDEMSTILHAMRRATTAAMVRAGHPAVTIRLDDWSEASVGALLMTLLSTTVLAGERMGVNPYGQPGVEEAKVSTKALLADPNGSAAEEIAELLGENDPLACP